MIKVNKFGPAFGLPDASPFVVKVETYCRMTDQKYEEVTADVRKSPRGQLPYIEVDGKVIPDSTAIVDYLEEKRSEKLDTHLAPLDRAVGQAFKSMLEEHLYFGILYMRWTTDDGWAVFGPKMREMLGSYGVPSFMRGIVSNSARKGVVERSARQGVGRQPREEVVKNCITIVDAFAEKLDGGPYLMGEKLTTFDATGYAFGAGVLCPAFDNELRKHASKKKSLTSYVDRMKDAYWKEAKA
jgi:glutathione S-transferase